MPSNVNTDRIIAYSAIFISILALVVSIWDGYETRKHNRLSVAPHIIITRKLTGVPDLTLKNAGLGPAKIRKIQFVIFGKYYNQERKGDKFFDVWPKVSKELGLSDITIFNLMIDTPIKAGEKEVLVRLRKDKETQENFEFLHQALLNLGVAVEYESIYGEVYHTRIIPIVR